MSTIINRNIAMYRNQIDHLEKRCERYTIKMDDPNIRDKYNLVQLKIKMIKFMLTLDQKDDRKIIIEMLIVLLHQEYMKRFMYPCFLELTQKFSKDIYHLNTMSD